MVIYASSRNTSLTIKRAGRSLHQRCRQKRAKMDKQVWKAFVETWESQSNIFFWEAQCHVSKAQYIDCNCDWRFCYLPAAMRPILRRSLRLPDFALPFVFCTALISWRKGLCERSPKIPKHMRMWELRCLLWTELLLRHLSESNCWIFLHSVHVGSCTASTKQMKDMKGFAEILDGLKCIGNKRPGFNITWPLTKLGGRCGCCLALSILIKWTCPR